MLLAEMKDVATKFADVISKVLDVDVLIVDSNLKTVGNTYRYFDKFTLIRRISVIGQVITTGEVVAIDDRTNHNACKECPDYKECEMSGFIGVPIFYNSTVVGAIALVLPKSKIPQIFKDVRNSVEFLERMADLLSSKLQNGDDYNNLNVIKREREVMMDSIEDAMVSMDDIGYITYYNKRFEQYFGIKESCIGKFIKDIVCHRFINEFLSNYTEFSGRLMYFEQDDHTFYGFLSCRNIKINESRTGMLFTFKSIGHVNAELADIGCNNTQTTFAWAENGLMAPHIVEKAKRLSITNKSVLIYGECGTGKEMLAEAIHNFSNRSGNSFITVRCDGSYRDLMETAIFGTDQFNRAFSGLGKLQLAHKGTIYISEIDRLPYYLQKRLADFLKTRTIRQAGMRDVQMDVRFIASSGKDLEKLVQDGYFDDELYYRISENSIKIPSLRDDKKAISRLISGGIRFYQEKYNKPDLLFDPAAIRLLEDYHWPGNRQELEETLDYLVRHGNHTVTNHDLAQIQLIAPESVATIQDMEKERIAALLLSNKNKDEVARMLGISRATLYRKIKTYNI
ncbi:sigma 54-interacting transcriptional regulator [Hydrogenoanaerobacterium sp.]|uniref:sigma 54-interacting transcriptional regulator n=1 Tax=Hydrogenoanaerobacterium sp. TaxID=2953763 RepID=UPI00289FA7CC|nr:sigma 54-interacting transcriptional regulator [Hydrogenoanaerobacterium sp.]